jgi:hypothetical protein
MNFSLNIIRVTKFRRIAWMGHVDSAEDREMNTGTLWKYLKEREGRT